MTYFYQFGIGGLFGRPVGGNLATPSYPQFFGVLQDVSIEMTGKNEALRGQNQYPDDVAPSDKEIKGKASFGRIDVNTYNALYFADTVSTGGEDIAFAEPHTSPSGTVTPSAWAAAHAYIIGDQVTDGTDVQVAITAGTSENPGPPTWNATLGGLTPDGATIVWQNLGVPGRTVTVTHAVDYVANLGVRYAATGQSLVQVSGGGEALGKYSVVETGGGKGIYTFSSADGGAALLFDYVYNVTTGVNLLVTNQLQGYGPVFEIYCRMPYQGQNNLKLYACRASKMSAPMKRNGYMISDFEFEAYAAASGNVFKWSQA